MTQIGSSSAARILQSLTDQNRLRSTFTNVLISSPHPQAIVKWVDQARRRNRRHRPLNNAAALSSSDSGSEKAFCLDRERFAEDMLAALQAEPVYQSRRVQTAAAVQTLVLSSGESDRFWQRPQPRAAPSADWAPYSMAELAEAVFERAGITRRRRIEPPQSPPSAGVAQLSLPRGGDAAAAARARALEDHISAYCPPHSFDLIVVEAGGTDADESHALGEWTDDVESGILSSPHLLTPTGSFLIVAPPSLRTHLNAAGITRFAKWRFREAYWAKWQRAEGEEVIYLVCSALAGESKNGLPDDSSFPGFAPVGTKRAKHWHPRAHAPFRSKGRNNNKGNYVASLRPSFTNAEHVRDSLQSTLDREEKKHDKMREDEEAFFGVAHEMVEKGWHYQRPEN